MIGLERPRELLETGGSNWCSGGVDEHDGHGHDRRQSSDHLAGWGGGPLASSLNWAAGDTTPNSVTTKLSPSGPRPFLPAPLGDPVTEALGYPVFR